MSRRAGWDVAYERHSFWDKDGDRHDFLGPGRADAMTRVALRRRRNRRGRRAEHGTPSLDRGASSWRGW